MVKCYSGEDLASRANYFQLENGFLFVVLWGSVALRDHIVDPEYI